MKKLTTEEFIERARNVHGDRYDYSKVEYKLDREPVEIICKIHGPFWQKPGVHARGNICQKCSGGILLTKEEYIDKCRLKHGDKYDYSKVIFNGVKKKIIIICPIHGDFVQGAEKHFFYGCQACGGNKRLNNEEFIKRSKEIFGPDKYNYSFVDYKSTSKEIILICNKHGKFKQLCSNHIAGKEGCKKCKSVSISKKETKWLDTLNIPAENRNKVVYIKKKKFIVDGLLKPGLIFEFLGDYWHGHPVKFKKGKNGVNKKTFKKLFKDTVKRIRLFRKHGYKVVCIWESEFDRKYGNR